MQNKIRGIFSKNLVTIKDSASIAEAHEMMEKHNFRHLPVVDEEGFLVGILSKNDYRALLRMEGNLKGIQVKELMSSPVKTFSINSEIKSVAQLFVVQKLSSGLVMDHQEIVGIVTSEDLLRLLAETHELDDEMEKMDLRALALDGWISSTSLR
ncbi:MAG: CBS domain-containing protein [Pseudobdellovibrio sp.]